MFEEFSSEIPMSERMAIQRKWLVEIQCKLHTKLKCAQCRLSLS